MKAIAALLCLLCAESFLCAAVKLPEASPAASVSRSIGVSEVRITYHSPAVKGRKIWGALVPLREVWRLGANEATRLELSHEAKIAGNFLAAGSYSLFAIPDEKEWTFIVNRKAVQWGTYTYDRAEDLFRFKVIPAAAPMTEWMTFTIDPVNDSSARVTLQWEKVRLTFPVEVDTAAIVWREIDTALAAQRSEESWRDYAKAAEYSLRSGKRTDEALLWIERSIELNGSFWNYELKARLLHQLGRTAEALPVLARSIELADGKAAASYVTALRKTEAAWKTQMTPPVRK